MEHNLLTRPALSCWLFGSVIVLVSAVATAQEGTATPEPLIWAVSQPPAPVLPTDPPTGLVFGLPPDLSSAGVAFDASGMADGPLSLEYLRFSRAGDGYATFHGGSEAALTTGATGGVLVVPDLAARRGGAFDPARDHLVTGVRTGLVGPRDVAVADTLGVLIVADFADADLKVFDLNARGDAAPLFVASDLGVTAAGEPPAPWGLAFDEARDRLYVAATDGTILVYDAFLARRGEAGPDRVITPTVDGAKAAANLHGVSYLSASDTLIVSDVGAATTADEPGFDTDGKVFVLENAASAAGDTEVAAQLGGPNSLLGNPVGLAFDGSALYIAEKTKDIVLRFDGVLELSGTLDPAPSGAVTVTAPESVTLTP